MVSATLFYHFVRTTALGWGRSANIGAADTTAQEFPLGVSQILCKHHRAVKNRARIIYWGGGLSATPCIVSDIGDAVSSTNYQCRLVVSRIWGLHERYTTPFLSFLIKLGAQLLLPIVKLAPADAVFIAPLILRLATGVARLNNRQPLLAPYIMYDFIHRDTPCVLFLHCKKCDVLPKRWFAFSVLQIISQCSTGIIAHPLTEIKVLTV